ncbi:MAG TPA: hypothetical protein VII45_02595 [Solirubrobacterales bacterium]
MSGQLNLLAPPSEDTIAVPICREVLYSGCRAHSGGEVDQPLFAHRHIPSAPPQLPDEAAWVAALEFAEEELRYKQSARAVLDLDQCSGTGCCGGRAGPSTPRLMSSSRGIEVDGILTTWSRLIKGRQEQRDVEFDLARARDLAEAYRLLDYYGHVYGDGPPYSHGREEWTPVPLIRRLAEEALDLGGEPAQLEPRTDYMRQGIEEVTRC